MKKSKDEIVLMLETYRSKKRRIKQLEFELLNPAQVTEAELIRAMAIGGSTYDTTQRNTSGNTMSVAANYCDISEQMNNEAVAQIKRELDILVRETSKLEYYVGLLDTTQAQMIRLRDFDGKPWSEIEITSDASERRLREQRHKGIASLAVMYGYIEDFIQ